MTTSGDALLLVPKTGADPTSASRSGRPPPHYLRGSTRDLGPVSHLSHPCATTSHMAMKDEVLRCRVPKALRARLRRVVKMTGRAPEREGLGPQSESEGLRRAIALGLTAIERDLRGKE